MKIGTARPVGQDVGRLGRRTRGGVVASIAMLLSATLLGVPAGAASPDEPDVVPGGTAAAAAVALPDYRALSPTRLADTRPGRATIDGQFAGVGKVSPSSPLLLTVGGRGGVPASGVAAVALNVTVTGPTAPGFVTAYPSGESRPTASNMNYGPGQTVANSVIAKLGADNRVAIHASSDAHVIVDVSGYFTTGGVNAVSPKRIADTRPGAFTVDGQGSGTGRISPSAPVNLQVTGRGGVPTSGVTAVALNVTVTGATGGGYLTAYPTGTPRPGASNVNFTTNQTVANSVVAKVASGGRVTLQSAGSATHAVVDLAGYFTSSSDYVALSPARFADTRASGSTVQGPSYLRTRTSSRTGPIGVSVGNGEQLDVLVSGRGDVPLADTGAVVLNVTVTSPSHSGHVTVFPLDTPMPTASSVNFAAGRAVPNLVIAKLGRGGGVSIHTSVPSTHLVVDVLGYVPGPSSANQPGEYSALVRDELGMPISYDRCYLIPYRINPANAQSGWIQDVKDAFVTLAAATGINFVYDGTTNEVPTDPRYNADHILVAFTTQTVIPALGGGVVGWGGSVYGGSFYSSPRPQVRWLPEQFFHGFAYIDSAETMPAGYGPGLTFGKVILHELGHVVGLGHVANSDELMNASVIARAGGFGTGDQSGLSLLYKTQGCPGSPATFGNALRAGVGKPVPEGTDLQIVTSADHHPEAHGH